MIGLSGLSSEKLFILRLKRFLWGLCGAAFPEVGSNNNKQSNMDYIDFERQQNRHDARQSHKMQAHVQYDFISQDAGKKFPS